jgi:hypothetical protein
MLRRHAWPCRWTNKWLKLLDSPGMVKSSMLASLPCVPAQSHNLDGFSPGDDPKGCAASKWNHFWSPGSPILDHF